MNAVPMIQRCHRHQWPADYGDLDGFTAYPTTAELEPIHPQPAEPIREWSSMPATGWCDRCGCDHTQSWLPAFTDPDA